MMVKNIKMGDTSTAIILGLESNGELVTFGELSAPDGEDTIVMRLRKRSGSDQTVYTFPVLEYDESSDPDYNAQVRLTQAFYDAVTPGWFVGEVDAQTTNGPVTFPDDGYINVRIVGSVD